MLIPCLISVIQNGFSIGNILGLTIGVLFLLSSQGIIDSRIVAKLHFPVIIILIGIKIILRDSFNKTMRKSINMNVNRNRRLDYTSIFDSQKEIYPNEQFDGTNIFTILGGML